MLRRDSRTIRVDFQDGVGLPGGDFQDGKGENSDRTTPALLTGLARLRRHARLGLPKVTTVHFWISGSHNLTENGKNRRLRVDDTAGASQICSTLGTYRLVIC